MMWDNRNVVTHWSAGRVADHCLIGEIRYGTSVNISKGIARKAEPLQVCRWLHAKGSDWQKAKRFLLLNFIRETYFGQNFFDLHIPTETD